MGESVRVLTKIEVQVIVHYYLHILLSFHQQAVLSSENKPKDLLWSIKQSSV